VQLVADGLGWVYAVAGRRAEALNIVRGFNDLSSNTYVDFYQLATIYAGLGEKDEAFRLLEKGYEQHSAGIPYLTIDPFWDAMRSDPRFADLLRRMGFPRLSGLQAAKSSDLKHLCQVSSTLVACTTTFARLRFPTFERFEAVSQQPIPVTFRTGLPFLYVLRPHPQTS
jgi:hypothetical protein